MAFFRRAPAPTEAPAITRPVSMREYRAGIQAGVAQGRAEAVELMELCMRSGEKDARRLISALRDGTLDELRQGLAVAAALRAPRVE